MHIGLIGGFGPTATADYYLRLVAAAEADSVPLHLTVAHGDMAAGMALVRAGKLEAEAKVLGDHAASLRAAGADVAILVSLSQHVMLEQIEAHAPMPFCSLLTALADHAAREDLSRIGVIGSATAMSGDVMGAYAGRDVLVPDDPAEHAAVSEAYFQIATDRHCTPERKALFDRAADRLMTRGAEVILLGGTDLSLAYRAVPPTFPAIDPVAVHVEALRPVIAA